MSEQDGKGPDETGAGSDQLEKPSRTAESVLAEANRKIDKIAQENAKLSQQLEQFMSRMQPAASSQSEDVDLDELIYKDPKQYAKRITENAKREAMQAVQQVNAQQTQANQVLAQLVNDYPELSDTNSELSKRAVDIYKSMSESDRASSLAYKVAVREAAAELGSLPKSKRSKSDDFTLGGSKGQQAATSSQPKQKDLDEATLKFAKAMGLNVDDKKVVERLKARAQRKTWDKYE